MRERRPLLLLGVLGMSSAVRLQSAEKALRPKGNILEFSMFTYE
jgi:hypothetical protein